jgi:hypothetical protein
VHILTGPIYVCDAAPGDVLQVRIAEALGNTACTSTCAGAMLPMQGRWQAVHLLGAALSHGFKPQHVYTAAGAAAAAADAATDSDP